MNFLLRNWLYKLKIFLFAFLSYYVLTILILYPFTRGQGNCPVYYGIFSTSENSNSDFVCFVASINNFLLTPYDLTRWDTGENPFIGIQFVVWLIYLMVFMIYTVVIYKIIPFVLPRIIKRLGKRKKTPARH